MAFFFPRREQLVRVAQADSPSLPYPGVPVDKGACRLLGPTALVRVVKAIPSVISSNVWFLNSLVLQVVQALMGGLVIASLVVKRQREKPMRPWRIWCATSPLICWLGGVMCWASHVGCLMYPSRYWDKHSCMDSICSYPTLLPILHKATHVIYIFSMSS